MTLLVACFLAVLLGLGAAVHEVCREPGQATIVSVRSLFHMLLAGILCLSILSVLLLEAGAFGIGRLLLLAAGALAVVALLATRRRPTFIVRLRVGRAQLLLLCILLLALFLRVPPFNWVVGGQDPGVYVNVANHIRRSGTVFIHDDLLRDARYASARDSYLGHSYLFTSRAAPSCNEGVYTPGIYVQDLANGILVPQFYHLHPLWLAISGSLFGQARATLLLPVFALLSIVLIYRLTNLLVRDQFAALSAGLLLAVNPLHSYMSKFPVSEVPTAFFFISGVYFFTRLLKGEDTARLNGFMTVLSFACLFLTRITGFLHIPVLLAFLAYALIVVFSRSRRRAIAICCAGIVAAYAYSVLHGHFFSCAYARDVYSAYFHTDFSTWAAKGTVALLAAAFVAICLTLHRYRRVLLREVARLRPWRHHLALLLLACVLGWSTHSAYTFASNEAIYSPELRSISIDPATSTKIAGVDIVALATLNLTVLNLLLTPVAVACALYGTYLLLRRWPSQPQMFFCGALTLYFLGLNTIAIVNSRHLYYYARYLLSETIPLLLVAAGIALGCLHRRWPRAAVLALLISTAPSLALSYLHTRETEMKHFYADVEGIAAALDEDGLVLIDRDIVPEWRRLGAPLKLSFDVSPFWFDRADLVKGRLDDVLRILVANNPNVFLVTNETSLATDYFVPYRTLPLRLNTFLAKWLSLPVGFVIERDTTVTVYRPTERLRDLAGSPRGSSAWNAQQFE